MRHFNNVIQTLNPMGGRGMKETIIVLTLIVAITFLAYTKTPIPQPLTILLTAVGSSILGYTIADKGGVKND